MQSDSGFYELVWGEPPAEDGATQGRKDRALGLSQDTDPPDPVTTPKPAAQPARPAKPVSDPDTASSVKQFWGESPGDREEAGPGTPQPNREPDPPEGPAPPEDAFPAAETLIWRSVRSGIGGSSGPQQSAPRSSGLETSDGGAELTGSPISTELAPQQPGALSGTESEASLQELSESRVEKALARLERRLDQLAERPAADPNLPARINRLESRVSEALGELHGRVVGYPTDNSGFDMKAEASERLRMVAAHLNRRLEDIQVEIQQQLDHQHSETMARLNHMEDRMRRRDRAVVQGLTGTTIDREEDRAGLRDPAR